MPAIVVHHLNNSRSQRLLWLLEELGLDDAVERCERDPNTMRARAALRQAHPLGKAPWFAGAEFSAADIQMSFPPEGVAARGGLDASRPNLMDFLDRTHACPAYARALERGGPYTLLR